jgi:hypothetical protein
MSDTLPYPATVLIGLSNLKITNGSKFFRAHFVNLPNPLHRNPHLVILGKTKQAIRVRAFNMAPSSLVDLVSALPSDESWGPPTSTETTLEGVPYAPYSKGDKLGRMADWSSEGKDGRDGRGGRQQYNRNYRGKTLRRTHCSLRLKCMV